MPIRAARTAVLATALAVLTSPVGPALLVPAHAKEAVERLVPQRLHVPRDATLVIHGRGYGHGHGLSQYGAEGAARRGLTAAQILAFYYPHTATGWAGGSVSVHLTADTDHTTDVLAQAGLSVRSLATGAVTPMPTQGDGSGARQWRLAAAAGGGTAVSYLSDTWHRWQVVPGDAQLQSTSGLLTLVLGDHDATYRGVLQSRSALGGRVTVDVLSLEDYLRSVVPHEMPATWSPAALEAQAVAARTYAAYEMAHPQSGVFQICDTTQCQVYGGVAGETAASDAAVAATAGQIRTYGGAAAFTQFSASDGGWTSRGGVPYLPAKRDPYDGWQGNRVHRWTARVPATAIERAWPQLGRLRSVEVDRRDGHGRWGGRVLRLTLHGSRERLVVSGDELRGVLGLRSDWVYFAQATSGGTRH